MLLSVSYRKQSSSELLAHEIGAKFSDCKKVRVTPEELIRLKKLELMGGIDALQVPETDANIRTMAKHLNSGSTTDNSKIFFTFMKRLNTVAMSELGCN